MGVARDSELVGGGRAQDVPVPGRHGKPTLAIESERRSPLEHLCEPLLQKKRNSGVDHHLIALFCTVAGKLSGASAVARGFSNEINDLEHSLQVSCWQKLF